MITGCPGRRTYGLRKGILATEGTAAAFASGVAAASFAYPDPGWGLRTARDDRHGVTGDEVAATRCPWQAPMSSLWMPSKECACSVDQTGSGSAP